jgi:3-hydroxyisobutyrate dehydrogenase
MSDVGECIGERIGWIGFGIMGRPMSANLLRAGFTVTGWNRTPSRLEAFAQAGGRIVESPAAVGAASDIVFTMVSDTADVEDVLFGERGIFETSRAGQLVVDMSTISPRATRNFAAKLRSRDVDFLDAPVSGGESGASAATLSIMVGGEPAVFDRCRPMFAALGKKATRLGPNGAGQATKLVNQVAVLGTLLAVCEALRMAAGCKLDVWTVIEAVGGGAGASWQLAQLGPKIVARDFAPGFPIRLARKDLRLVLEAADELHLPLPLTELVRALFEELGAAGGDEEGTQALFKALERRSAVVTLSRE